MKRHIWLMPAGMLLAAAVGAENLTERSIERANAIIAAAVEAHGGSEKLAAMQSIVREHETVNYAVGQSRKPEPPWDKNDGEGLDAIDLQKQVFVTTNTGNGGGFEFDNATIISGTESYQLDYRAGLATPIAEPDFDTTSGPFVRVTPALLIRQLQEHARTAHYLGEAAVEGRKSDVIAFSMTVGPAISLYFDRATHLLTKSERVLPNVGLVEYFFQDYSSIDGIPFNKRFVLLLNGETNIDRDNRVTKVNVPIDEHTRVSADLTRVAALAPDELSRQKIADGVYLVGANGTYVMFIEMSDHVIAVGGTAGVPDRIRELRAVVPDKPIRYGVLTHHHFDHVVAVPTYAAEGATVVAARSHETVVREAAGEDVELALDLVDARKTLTDGERRVEIIDIGPTAHSEHLLVTYLPAEGILFEADHFAMPRSGPVRPAVSSTKSFAAALERLKIDADTFVSAHSPIVGRKTDLRASVEKAAVTVGRN